MWHPLNVRSMTHLIVAADLARAIAQAGGDPTLEGRALQDALPSAIAIADRRGYLSWDVDDTGWLMAPEIGLGQFLM